MGNTPLVLGIAVDSGDRDHRSAWSSSCHQRPVVGSGTTFTGTVYLQVNNADPISNAAAINLRFKGTEETTIRYRSSNKSHKARDSVDFLNVDFPLVSFAAAQTLSRGQYEYPFQVTLPPHLPASMFWRDSNGSKCQIKYELEARVVRRTRGGIASLLGAAMGCDWILNARTTKLLQVLGDPRPDSSSPSPVILPVETEPIRLFCCFHKGSMTLTSQVERDCFAAGDSMRVSFKARNNSTAEVQEVRITLYERIRWKARDRTKVHQRVVQQMACPATSFAELQALTQAPPAVLSMRRRYGPVGSSEEGVAAAEDPEASLARQEFRDGSLDIPPNVRESHLSGRLISVDHFLKVQLVTGMCLSTPENMCRLVIQSPPMPTSHHAATAATVMIPEYETEIPEAQQVTVLPHDWSAIAADVVTIPMAHATVVGPVTAAAASSSSAGPAPSAPPPPPATVPSATLTNTNVYAGASAPPPPSSATMATTKPFEVL